MGWQRTLTDLHEAENQQLDPGTGEKLGVLGNAWNVVFPFTIAASASETNDLPAPTGPNQRVRMVAMSVGSGGSRTVTLTGLATTLIFATEGGYATLEAKPTDVATYAWEVVASKAVTGTAIQDPTFDDVTVDALTAASATITGNITQSSAAVDHIYKANTAAALEITDGTTSLVTIDTRNTIADVNGVTITTAATTIATAAADHLNASLKIASKTITYTGTNTVTSQLGAMLNVGVLTLTDAAAGTVSLASAIHINAVAAAGGMLTLTAARMISTSVSDCYLTNAGVWTDTMCWASGKNNVAAADDEEIDGVLDRLQPHKWRYKPEVHGDDGVPRIGIMYDELPQELTLPGAPNADGRRGVSAGLLSSFALAAIRSLRDKNKMLEKRLAALEAA